MNHELPNRVNRIRTRGKAQFDAVFSKAYGNARGPLGFQYARPETSDLSNDGENEFASMIDKLHLVDTLVVYIYELRRRVNKNSSMDAGADPRTWSVSNVQLSDLIYFTLADSSHIN